MNKLENSISKMLTILKNDHSTSNKDIRDMCILALTKVQPTIKNLSDEELPVSVQYAVDKIDAIFKKITN